MTTATAPRATYQPRILQPRLRKPIPGVRVFLVQSERDQNAFHFIGIYPTGYIRCTCEAAKHNRLCHHKLALCEHIERQQKVEPMLRDMSPREMLEAFNRRRQTNKLPLLPVAVQHHLNGGVTIWQRQAETVAAKAERAVIQNHTPETFSIFACTR